MESELRSKARSSVIQINYAAFSMLKSQGTYEEIQKRAGFQEPNIKGDLMALEELFVPNLPQMYRATAQLLRNCPSMEVNPHEDTPTALQLSRQFQVCHKLSIRSDAESKKTAVMRFLRTAKTRLIRTCRLHLGVDEEGRPIP